MRAEATRDLDASRAEVWGFLTEPYHLSDWWPGISSVRPDRRGLAPGARWEVVGPRQPTLFRKAYSSGLLLVRDVHPYERFAWHVLSPKLDAEVSIAATGPDRTQVTVTSSRGSPTRALQRLYDLVQTAAGLDKPPS